MPELEEGNLWVRGTFPLNISLEGSTKGSAEARKIMATYPEVEAAVNEIGRPDDGTDSDGYYNSEFFVPLRPQKQWPAVVERTGWRRWVYGPKRPRTKVELVDAMSAEMSRKIPGADWNFSQNIRDNVMEAMSGVKGDNSVKIFGPDLDELDRLADKVKDRLKKVPMASRTSGCSTSRGRPTSSSASICRSARSGASTPPTSTTSSRPPSEVKRFRR